MLEYGLYWYMLEVVVQVFLIHRKPYLQGSEDCQWEDLG
jgi:hypothetical protein